MEGTLVYDSARDAATEFSIGTLGLIAVIVGMLLMAVPLIRTVRRQPEKRTRGVIGLGLLAVIGLAAVFGGPMLETSISASVKPQDIEGVIGTVSPKLFTVGGMKVMVSCADAARCPGVKPGDYARVAYVDDSGPETDALATKIWKLPARGTAR